MRVPNTGAPRWIQHRTELFEVHYLLPGDPDDLSRLGIQQRSLGLTIPGEFIIIRRSRDGRRAHNMRTTDRRKVELALLRWVPFLLAHISEQTR